MNQQSEAISSFDVQSSALDVRRSKKGFALQPHFELHPGKANYL
jgi:hypothetical protein